jgi:hypothetical protein
MSAFSSLTSALHLLGKAIDPQSITKVVMSFEHIPSDLPGMLDGDWSLNISLVGTKNISDEGASIAFKQEYSGRGNTEMEAFNEAFKQVQQATQNFLLLRMEESTYAEQAMKTVCDEQNPDLASMWPSSDTREQGEPEQEG